MLEEEDELAEIGKEWEMVKDFYRAVSIYTPVRGDSCEASPFAA